MTKHHARNLLTATELEQLIISTFSPRPEDKQIAILVDFPATKDKDHLAWRERREMAADWAAKLQGVGDSLHLHTSLFGYPQVKMNNGDLPTMAAALNSRDPLPPDGPSLLDCPALSFKEIFSAHTIILAPTEYSATAPLKLAAPQYGFRAATMPGFSSSMIEALRLDYAEVNRRVEYLQGLLNEAEEARLIFRLENGQEYQLSLDLRFRQAHASGGRLITSGTAGNLPSGEAYIVPYEGEQAQEPSRSLGTLPVQFGAEVVLYEIVENRARRVLSEGPASKAEAALLAAEPAYGNLAELGLGVLDDFGVKPSGEVLLDEKLGLHLAFGRSDHFGGATSARDFTSPEAVVHIDRVYIPALQPQINLVRVDLFDRQKNAVPLIRAGRYVIDFDKK